MTSTHTNTGFSSAMSRSTTSGRISSSSFAISSVQFDLDLNESRIDEENERDIQGEASHPVLQEGSQESSEDEEGSTSQNSEMSHMDPNDGTQGLHNSINTSSRSKKKKKKKDKKLKLAKTRSSLQLARRETRQIWWLKGITILIFMLAAFLVGFMIFDASQQTFQENFEMVFQEQAQLITVSFSNHLNTLLSSLDQWSIQYASASSSSSFGNEGTTLDNYAARASSMQQLSGATWIAMAPLITNAKVWEDYSSANVASWTSTDLGDDEGLPIEPSTKNGGPFAPLWQNYPIQTEWINQDLLQTPAFQDEMDLSLSNLPPTIVLGNFQDIALPNNTTTSDASSTIYVPIVPSSQDEIQEPSGMILGRIAWLDFLAVPSENAISGGIVAIVSSTCPGNRKVQQFAYELKSTGSSSSSMSWVLLSKIPNDSTLVLDQEVTLSISDVLLEATDTLSMGLPYETEYCVYDLNVYPTEIFQEAYVSKKPGVYAASIVAAFVFCSLVFLVYDHWVERRQKVVMKSAKKSHEIVAGLFPEVVRNRLFGDSMHSKQEVKKEKGQGWMTNSKRDKSEAEKEEEDLVKPLSIDFLGNPEANNVSTKGTPIADLFTHTTVLFADIAGFTAWSSVRNPAQVFTLLETIYAAFDNIALERHVFKVETIGDCYVAVTGLPQPQDDHALIMVKFAKDILLKMQQLTQSLEIALGPDTGDLSIRIGMHSGPVTAGVLRGQKSRFQLFGDTVNFASRMESNSYPNQIQCSQQTAEFLQAANKGHWVHPRKDLVHAKGKGLVQTYWILANKAGSSKGDDASAQLSPDKDDDASDITEEPLNDIVAPPKPSSLSKVRPKTHISPHLQRLISWNVDLLAQCLKSMVATRDDEKVEEKEPGRSKSIRMSRFSVSTASAVQSDDDTLPEPPKLLLSTNPRDEYAKAIELPHFDPNKKVKQLSEIDLDDKVMVQLEDFVMTIACAYNDNPFHNFEHASHVSMSANKILMRVVNADDVQVRRGSLCNLASKIHDYTYGITSDPLTHFACLFSAMIHDVDHPGVSNAQLLKEQHELSTIYEGKSIAEQNSFDFAWELLMDTEFQDLRRCLFQDEGEVKRFRQLVINFIMATDVFDPDLVAVRNERWRKVFPDPEASDKSPINGDAEAPLVSEKEMMDLKATIVIEHMIQAADVAHTMQHWHVYQKWNRRLFEEMYAAYKSGRGSADPADSWYKGELWFFDNYIIPLAKKLKECQVFGASSAEFLTYAMDNRSEWETKGEKIVEEMIDSCTHQSEEFILMQMSHGEISFNLSDEGDAENDEKPQL